MSELFESVIAGIGGGSGLGSDLPDLDTVFGPSSAAATSRNSKMDLLSASLQDSGILRPNNHDEEWLLDNDTDDLLKSMLTGVSDQGASGSAGPGNLLDVEAGAGGVDFDRQLLSPADSAVSSGSGSHSGSSYGAGTTPPTSRTAIDFMDIFNDDMDVDDKSLIQTCVNPHTNSPLISAAQVQQQPPTTLLTTAEPTTVTTKKPARTNRRQKQHQTSVAPHVTQATRVVLKAARSSPGGGTPTNGPRRVASTNVYHHATSSSSASAASCTKPVISVVRSSSANHGSIALAPASSSASPSSTSVGGQPFTITGNASSHHQATFETGTTTIYLPVLNAKSVQQPTIIRMNPATAAASIVTTSTTPAGLSIGGGVGSGVGVGLPQATISVKRRRLSASSDDSGASDDALSMSPEGSLVGKPVGGKYPRLHLNEEERKLCEKEGIALPSHYPLTKEEERNLKRIRRKIRNKQSAQDSRKRKKEHVENMEARAMKCAQENAELVKKLSQLEAQNKTLVGQLRRLHQIIVNKGGIGSSKWQQQPGAANPGQAASMQGQGAKTAGLSSTGGGQGQGDNKGSTALMVLLLSTALFLIPGMKDQLETKPSLDIQQAVKSGPPIVPGQSRSLLHFAPQHSQIKQEQQQNQEDIATTDQQQFANPAAAAAAAQQQQDSLNSSQIKTRGRGGGDHDYTGTSGGGGGGAPGGQVRKRSYVVADAPTLGYGNDKNVVTVIQNNKANNKVKQEKNGDNERRLNVSVTGGQSGPGAVVLTVPKGL